MAKVYEFLANGFEDVEALAVVDILRRGGVEVKTVSISDDICVTSSHDVTVKADLLFDEIDDFCDADMLLLPGGMPGAAHLKDHTRLAAVLQKHHEGGKRIGAICAAPMVLGCLGILKGMQATCYPGFDKFLEGANYTAELVTIDRNITTAKGPAASFLYAFTLLRQLTSEEKAEEVKNGMLINELIALHK